MRRICAYILVTVCFLLASCNIVTSDNGDLDGLWQMTTFENLKTGEVCDGRQIGGGLNWAFQGHLLVMRGADELIFSFEHGDRVLKLYNPYLSGRFTETSDDTPITDATQLNVYGVYQLEEFFRILELNSSNMRLESANVRLTFRKY